MKIVAAAFIIFLFTSNSAFAFVYTRLPSTEYITPETLLQINILFDIAEIDSGLDCFVNNTTCYAAIGFTGVEGDGFSDIFDSSICTELTEFTNFVEYVSGDVYPALPLGAVEGVTIGFYTDDTCTGSLWGSGSIEWIGGMPTPAFYMVENIPTTPINNIYGAGGLMGTSTNLLAAVAGGVTSTGSNIWPLFLLVGVALAFVIAVKVQSFIMQAGAQSRTNTEKEQRFARTGDYKAYKRGKKNLPKLWRD